MMRRASITITILILPQRPILATTGMSGQNGVVVVVGAVGKDENNKHKEVINVKADK